MPALTLLAAPVLAAALISAPVVMDSTPSPTAGAGVMEKACARIPVRIERVEKVQARLAGDAETKGSIARAQMRMEKARAEGREDAAKIFENRVAIRKDIAAALPDILVHLKSSAEVCAK
jgi:hypothetical protein